jgi:hypothetical protein
MIDMKGEFRTESTSYDYFTIQGVKYGGGTPPPGTITLSVGETLTWRSDGSQQYAGFTLCLQPLTPTPQPTPEPTPHPSPHPSHYPTPHPTPVPTGPPVTLALQHSWDFTGTDTSTPLCVTAQYLYIDGSAAAGYLNLREVVLKGADGEVFTIVSGAMSSTNGGGQGGGVSKCFDGVTSDPLNLCHTSSGWWAYFDLGVPQCVGAIEIYNRGPEIGRASCRERVY